jgi:hypothetical protein
MLTTGTIGTFSSRARRRKPRRPPKSIRADCQEGRLTSQSPPGYRAAAAQRPPGVLGRRGDGAEAAQHRPDPGIAHDEVVGELVEAALDPEPGAEGEGEDQRVGARVAPGVIADEEHRALLGDVLEPAHLGAVPDRGEQP